jgi:hypothetical protein
MTTTIITTTTITVVSMDLLPATRTVLRDLPSGRTGGGGGLVIMLFPLTGNGM